MMTPDADSIRQQIAVDVLEQMDRLEVFSEIESTNSYLLGLPAPAPGRLSVALADHQTAGRGRRDRRWLSPPGTGLCMSLAYTFAKMPVNPGALTLAIGTAAIAALEQLDFDGLMLKWPNDLMANDCKLAGILAEVGIGDSDGVTVVLGFGLNIDFQTASNAGVDSIPDGNVIDLRSLQGNIPDRALLSAGVIKCMFDCLTRYERSGFSAFHSDWRQYDWLNGRTVEIDNPDSVVTGVANGIDTDGALLMTTSDGPRRVISGSVTVLPDAVSAV
jgi:BirA family biotin operon repressor/biotin-[acetyl-CoA-carboxylase] ligase